MSKAKAQSPYRPLAEQLRAMIQQSGMSTRAVAAAVGMPQPVLQRFVAGDRENIRLDTADKLAEFFGVELRPACKPAKPKTK
jgi:transcriptional regulator with XRE-family HTH domain